MNYQAQKLGYYQINNNNQQNISFNKQNEYLQEIQENNGETFRKNDIKKQNISYERSVELNITQQQLITPITKTNAIQDQSTKKQKISDNITPFNDQSNQSFSQFFNQFNENSGIVQLDKIKNNYTSNQKSIYQSMQSLNLIICNKCGNKIQDCREIDFLKKIICDQQNDINDIIFSYDKLSQILEEQKIYEKDLVKEIVSLKNYCLSKSIKQQLHQRIDDNLQIFKQSNELLKQQIVTLQKENNAFKNQSLQQEKQILYLTNTVNDYQNKMDFQEVYQSVKFESQGKENLHNTQLELDELKLEYQDIQMRYQIQTDKLKQTQNNLKNTKEQINQLTEELDILKKKNSENVHHEGHDIDKLNKILEFQQEIEFLNSNNMKYQDKINELESQLIFEHNEKKLILDDYNSRMDSCAFESQQNIQYLQKQIRDLKQEKLDLQQNLKQYEGINLELLQSEVAEKDHLYNSILQEQQNIHKQYQKKIDETLNTHNQIIIKIKQDTENIMLEEIDAYRKKANDFKKYIIKQFQNVRLHKAILTIQPDFKDKFKMLTFQESKPQSQKKQ